jgi:hypothetical protein
MGFAESDTNTASATDTQSLSSDNTAGPRSSAVYLVTGLSTGSTTFTAKYKSGSGVLSCTFADRGITVIPY